AASRSVAVTARTGRCAPTGASAASPATTRGRTAGGATRSRWGSWPLRAVSIARFRAGSPVTTERSPLRLISPGGACDGGHPPSGGRGTEAESVFPDTAYAGRRGGRIRNRRTCGRDRRRTPEKPTQVATSRTAEVFPGPREIPCPAGRAAAPGARGRTPGRARAAPTLGRGIPFDEGAAMTHPTGGRAVLTPGPQGLAHLELLLAGACPLPGFMTRREADRLDRPGPPPAGAPWPVPVVLAAPDAPADAREVVLTDPEGAPLAELTVTEAHRDGTVRLAGPVRPAAAPVYGSLRSL